MYVGGNAPRPKVLLWPRRQYSVKQLTGGKSSEDISAVYPSSALNGSRISSLNVKPP